MTCKGWDGELDNKGFTCNTTKSFAPRYIVFLYCFHQWSKTHFISLSRIIKLKNCSFPLIFSALRFCCCVINVAVVHQFGTYIEIQRSQNLNLLADLIQYLRTSILTTEHCSWMLESGNKSRWPTIDPLHWIIGNYCYKD